MAKAAKLRASLFLILTLFFFPAASSSSSSSSSATHSSKDEFLADVVSSEFPRKLMLMEGNNQVLMRSLRRIMIGSTAPTCTYNECRGCKYKCRAQQVPVEGNDPINSAYHYRCVCQR